MKFVRSLVVGVPDIGHDDLTVDVNEGTNGLMPIRIMRKDDVVHLRWSEWEKVRDHVEYCATMMKPEPVEITQSGDPWEACGASPGLVPYEGLPCILERGHGDPLHGDPHHVDRRGRRW